eukprot:781033_1
MMASNKQSECSSNGEIETVSINNVLDKISEIWSNEQKTPLILNESGLMDRFYLHRDANIIDAKSLFLKEKMQNIAHDDIMEDMRCKLVQSMKYGKTLVVSMQNSAADIVGNYSGKDTFPAPDVFIPTQITNETVWKEFVNEEDKIYPNTNVKQFIVKPEFQVVITSQFSVQDYQEFLEQALPLKCCKVLCLTESRRGQAP